MTHLIAGVALSVHLFRLVHLSLQLCPVCRIYRVDITALVLCLEMNVASLRDIDDVSRTSGNDSAVDLDLKGSLKNDIVLVIGQGITVSMTVSIRWLCRLTTTPQMKIRQVNMRLLNICCTRIFWIMVLEERNKKGIPMTEYIIVNVVSVYRLLTNNERRRFA